MLLNRSTLRNSFVRSSLCKTFHIPFMSFTSYMFIFFTQYLTDFRLNIVYFFHMFCFWWRLKLYSYRVSKPQFSQTWILLKCMRLCRLNRSELENILLQSKELHYLLRIRNTSIAHLNILFSPGRALNGSPALVFGSAKGPSLKAPFSFAWVSGFIIPACYAELVLRKSQTIHMWSSTSLYLTRAET